MSRVDLTTVGVVMAMAFGDTALKTLKEDDLNAALDHVVVVIGRSIAAQRAKNNNCDRQWDEYVTGIEARLRSIDGELERETAPCQGSTSVSQ